MANSGARSRALADAFDSTKADCWYRTPIPLVLRIISGILQGMKSPFFALGLGLSLICGGWSARADLLVSSFSGHRVLRYSESNGVALGVFITNGSGGLNLPHGLAVGPDGNLYVASAGNDAVLRYNGTNGAFLGEFIPSTNGVLDYPVGLEFRPDGFLYVSSQLNNSVARFQATNGVFAGVFVTNGSGGLNGPSGLTFGPDGHLYVVARFGNEVLRYDGTNGAFLGAFVPASGNFLAQPFGGRFGPDGNFYVASGNGNKIARFDGKTGASLGDFVAAGGGGVSLPIGLEFGPDGALYAASFNNHKIARFNGVSGVAVADFVSSGSGGLAGPNFFLFRPAQTFSTNIPGLGPVGPVVQRHLGLIFTEGPAADAHGTVYFSDVQSNRVYRTDPSGLLGLFLTNSSACNGLMCDQSGRIIACQRDLRRIIAIDPATTNVTALATNWSGRAFLGPNDLVVDAAGGVYFTDPFFSGSLTPTQSVYYAAANGAVSLLVSNLTRPNGVILSPDESKLYVVLSGAANLLTYPVNGPGLLGPPVTTVLPRTGDGMTLDTLGNLYLCQPGGSNITVLSPAGAVLGAIRFPEQPANCTFGGKDMKTLFVTARTSLYTCRMEATGHRFAWNPPTYAAFQKKFFNATNASASAPDADPDADGASNQLEYLTRTHPLCAGDAWRISLQRAGEAARISFLQISGRGFEVEHQGFFPAAGSWPALSAPGNPPAVSTTNRTAIIEDSLDPATNRFYRVRVFEP